MSVYINIYGPANIGCSVGKILSDNDIYLQHPKHNEEQLGYKNPHYFTGPEEENSNKAPVLLVNKLGERIKTLFETSVNSSLPEVEVGSEVMTSLLR